MGPQGLSITTGSGLCTIRLNAAETQATVKFSYSGLTTAVTGKHIHNDQYLTHPSQIIFDMDTAIPQPDGSYLWNIGPVGTFTNPAEIVQLIQAEGKSYINIHTVNYPSGEIRGNLTIANGAQNFVAPAHPQPGLHSSQYAVRGRSITLPHAGDLWAPCSAIWPQPGANDRVCSSLDRCLSCPPSFSSFRVWSLTRRT